MRGFLLHVFVFEKTGPAGRRPSFILSFVVSNSIPHDRSQAPSAQGHRSGTSQVSQLQKRLHHSREMKI